MIGRYTTGLRRTDPPHTELNGPADLNLSVTRDRIGERSNSYPVIRPSHGRWLPP